MDHSSPRRWLLNLLVGAGLSAIAAASLAAPPDDDWHLQTSGGIWAMSIDGTVGARNVESDVDVSFSDLELNTNFGDTEDFGKDWALNVGYRAVSWDYDEDDFKWDTTFHGPWIGITHRWFQETFASLWVRTARNTSEKLTKSISPRT